MGNTKALIRENKGNGDSAGFMLFMSNSAGIPVKRK